MNRSIFLVDANVLITPYRQYYPFDFAKTFWDQLRTNIENGNIAILDMVKAELLNGEEKDGLKTWISEIKIQQYIKHNDPDILQKYIEIMRYIQSCGFYSSVALRTWAQPSVADPWLIAAAKSRGYSLVTLEQSVHSLDTKNPTKRVRIPDVAKHFNVEIVNLFDMIRCLGIIL